MKYMGSKSRIARYVAPIIQQRIDDNNIKNYLEPFVGGANIIDKIRCENKYGSDNNKYLIALYENLDKVKELPNFISKDFYSDVRNSYNNKDRKYDDWMIGAIGFLASYNGRFFDGGYAGVVKTKSGVIRDYYDEAKRNLMNQIPDVGGVIWRCGDYKELYSELSGYCIYCDPPYESVKQYGTSKEFNHVRFWNWAEKMSKDNIVIVSEHHAPSGWDCIWSQEINRTIDNNKRVKATEKLFEKIRSK